MTARTLTPLRARGFDFSVDLFHRHRRYLSGGDTFGNRQQRVGRLLAAERLLDHAL